MSELESFPGRRSLPGPRSVNVSPCLYSIVLGKPRTDVCEILKCSFLIGLLDGQRGTRRPFLVALNDPTSFWGQFGFSLLACVATLLEWLFPSFPVRQSPSEWGGLKTCFIFSTFLLRGRGVIDVFKIWEWGKKGKRLSAHGLISCMMVSWKWSLDKGGEFVVSAVVQEKTLLYTASHEEEEWQPMRKGRRKPLYAM